MPDLLRDVPDAAEEEFATATAAPAAAVAAPATAQTPPSPAPSEPVVAAAPLSPLPPLPLSPNRYPTEPAAATAAAASRQGCGLATPLSWAPVGVSTWMCAPTRVLSAADGLFAQSAPAATPAAPAAGGSAQAAPLAAPPAALTQREMPLRSAARYVCAGPSRLCGELKRRACTSRSSSRARRHGAQGISAGALAAHPPRTE